MCVAPGGPVNVRAGAQRPEEIIKSPGPGVMNDA